MLIGYVQDCRIRDGVVLSSQDAVVGAALPAPGGSSGLERGAPGSGDRVLREGDGTSGGSARARGSLSDSGRSPRGWASGSIPWTVATEFRTKIGVDLLWLHFKHSRHHSYPLVPPL